MDSSISKILSTNSTYSTDLYTHCTFYPTSGKYHFEKQVQEEFWEHYIEVLSKNKNIGMAIGEKPHHHMPVVADIDIKVERNSEEIPDALIQQKHIIQTVEIYQSVLRTILEDCTDENLICVVLTKPLYTVPKKTGGDLYVKNGFHLHFPYTFMSRNEQERDLIPRIIKEIKNDEIFADIDGLGEISKIIDKNYTNGLPWMLYGSVKNDTQEPYLVNTIFDGDCEEITIEEAFSDYKIFNDGEEQIDYGDDIMRYMPRILSIIPYGREEYICEVRKNIVPLLEPNQIIKSKQKTTQFASSSLDENMTYCEQLMPLLSEERAEDYDSWMRVGWALFNICENNEKALETGYKLWIEFSEKCKDKFDQNCCRHTWSKNTFREDGPSIGSIVIWAREDSPELFKKLREERLQVQIEQSLNASHHDIAKLLKDLEPGKFVCASTKRSEWYEFINHRWCKIEDGIKLRMKISTDIYQLFKKEYKSYRQKWAEADDNDDEGEKAKFNTKMKQLEKTLSNLKSAPYKNNIMKEASEIFYDGDFNKKLNSNPWKIGFKNGVYDLKDNIFRDGSPDDYISLQMGVNYNDDIDESDERVRKVEEFLEKIFPDTSVREYFVNTSSEVFVGGNHNKNVMVWSGDGDNGKSITQTIFEKMLGEYSIKLPTTFLVGKRTQSSAACPELVRAGNGVRWVVLQEPDQGDTINIGLLKEMTGNDTFYARGLFQEGSEITPMFKMALICNEPPKVPYDDKAVWNRIRINPFESKFCDQDECPPTYEEQLQQKRFLKDPHFNEQIPQMTEAFAWYLLNHRKKCIKIIEPEKVKLATAAYRKKNDIYRQYVDERIQEVSNSWISIDEVYSEFKEWFRESMPNSSIPSKIEVKDYFLKLWGEFDKSVKWKGYRVRTIEDDIEEGEALILGDEDLVDYNKNSKPDL